MQEANRDSDKISLKKSSNCSDPFSIATRTVTTMAAISNDTSFLLPLTPNQQDPSQAEQQMEPIGAPSDQTDRTHLGRVEIITQDSTANVDTMTLATKEPSKDIESSAENSANNQDDATKGKKRNKINKKSGKLDARSKLEKSRQSARECRARKKLRYQYLEDLVCNREKAVVKLRDELAMFCELSKRIDSGPLSDADRKLLLDQSNDNNKV